MKKRLLLISFHLIFIIVLTLLSEVGGIIYILALLSILFVRHHSRKIRYSVFLVTFIDVWMLCITWIIPSLAARYNKVPLPFFASEEFPAKPVTLLYPILFRNYVTPTLRDELQRSALAFKKLHGRNVVYLDGCFPLGNTIPLLPHLSHNDGRKLDLAFFFKDASSGGPVPPPSPVGYWAYTQPRADEPQPCRGVRSPLRWDMAWLQPWFSHAVMDEEATGALVSQLLQSPKLQKVLVEPHLKARLGVVDSRIRFQGCSAARHDDHLHIQTRE